MAKMNNKMIAMCSAAIGIIYGAGYFVTDTVGATTAQPAATTSIQTAQNDQPSGQDQQDQQGQTGQPRFGRHHHHGDDGHFGGDGDRGGQWGGQDGQNGQNGDGGQRNPGGQNISGQGQQAQPGNSGSSTQTPAPSANVKYKDGTYSGTGTTRIGSVTVSVTIKSNKITDVQITDCSTHYPENLIADMPQQVLQRQKANIDFVSGATLSSEDFQNAVQQALQQAQA